MPGPRAPVVMPGLDELVAGMGALTSELAATRDALAGLRSSAPGGASPFAPPSRAPGGSPQDVGGVPSRSPSGGGDTARWKKRAEDAEAKLKSKSSEPTRVIGAGNASLKYIARDAGISRQAFRAPITAAALGLMKLALGNMTQLNAIVSRAQLNFRGLFHGVDASPVTRAATKFFQVFDRSTVTGKALDGIFTRSFNALFSLIEKAQPYATAFFQGMVLGALYLENAWLRLRIAMLPITFGLASLIPPTQGIAIAAALGGGALALMAIAAAAAAAPFVALAGAIVAVTANLVKLGKEWDENSFNQIKAKLGQDLGLTSAEDAEKAIQVKSRGAFEANAARSGGVPILRAPRSDVASYQPENNVASYAPAGYQTGQGFGQGVEQGIRDAAPGVGAAAGELGQVADRSLRSATETHSPSEMFRRTGRNMGEGVAVGEEDSAPRVQAAAEASFVPQLPAGAGSPGGAAAGQRGGGQAILHVTVVHQWPAGVEAAKRKDVEAAGEEGMWRALRTIGLQLGMPVEAT